MTFQTAVATALTPVAPSQTPDTAAAIIVVAEALQHDLAQGVSDRRAALAAGNGARLWRLRCQRCLGLEAEL